MEVFSALINFITRIDNNHFHPLSKTLSIYPQAFSAGADKSYEIIEGAFVCKTSLNTRVQ